MENLKQLISKIDANSPTPLDMRVLSFKHYYLDLRKNKDMKKIKRLKLVFSLYPNILLKNDFRHITSLVETPSNVFMKIRDVSRSLTKFEEYALLKNYGVNLPSTNCSPLKYKLSDLYEYFGV